MKKTINVNGTEIRLLEQDASEFLSLTDIAKNFSDRQEILIQNWMRNRNTIEYLGAWEQLNNPDFKYIEFDVLRNQAGLNSFVLTSKRWIETTAAIGIRSKRGRGGGTFAHRDIALEFCSYISPVFRLYIVTEFKRLKEEESERNNYALEWTVRRELSKINYHIHKDAVESLIPKKVDNLGKRFIFSDEADLLNVALFGMTAAVWREVNPDKKGNIREYATLEQLTVLSNLENLNSEYIKAGFEQDERIHLLNQRAIEQMGILLKYNLTKGLEDTEEKIKRLK